MKKITYETLFLFRQLQNEFFLIFILKIAKETGGSIPVAPSCRPSWLQLLVPTLLWHRNIYVKNTYMPMDHGPCEAHVHF